MVRWLLLSSPLQEMLLIHPASAVAIFPKLQLTREPPAEAAAASAEPQGLRARHGRHPKEDGRLRQSSAAAVDNTISDTITTVGPLSSVSSTLPRGFIYVGPDA